MRISLCYSDISGYIKGENIKSKNKRGKLYGILHKMQFSKIKESTINWQSIIYGVL